MDIGKHPYAFYLIALSMGIFLYPYISISLVISCVILFVLLVFSGFIVYTIRFRILFSVLILCCWFLLGIFLVKLNTYISGNHYIHFEKKYQAQYVVVVPKEQNNSNERNRKYTAEVKAISYENKLIRTSGKILLLLDKEKFDSVLILGNEYKILIKIHEVQQALNPHQFDYQKYLERNYILRTGQVDKIISQESHSSFWYSIKNSNQLLAQKIDKSVLSPDSKEFLKAYLLGDRSEMKRDMIDAYSKAGIMHLIAISGTHIMFIFGMVFFIFSLLFGRRNRKAAIISSLLFVWLFGCFVGLSSSVFRSCLMITIYYIFELLKRTSNIYHSLSLSAILILLCSPYEIYSVGFQLSYVAVFFMSWLGPWLTKYLKVRNKKITQWIMEPLAITIVAQLGTLPFVLYYFHQFSLLSIPVNILVIPYTFVITYSSVLELFVVFLPANFQVYFGIFYDFLVMLLVESSRWVSSADVFLFRRISLNLWELISLVSAIVLLRYFLVKPQLKTAIPFLICLVVFQFDRLIDEYEASERKDLIVFDNKFPLVGFREGKNLLLMEDKNDNHERIQSFIIEPYIIGEHISKIEYEYIDYNKIYSWKSRKIEIVDKNANGIPDSVEYLVLKGFPKIDLGNNKTQNIVFTGNIYPGYAKKIKEKIPESKMWITKDKGAFITSP